MITLTIDRQAGRSEASAVLDSMRQGFRFIFTHSTISFVILSMTAGMFAMRCFGALLSVYARDVLVATSAVFSVLNTLIGVGMIVGTQLLTRFARHVPQQNLVAYGLGGMGVAVLITAAGMLGLGFCAAAIFITATTLIQQETPHELLGRVMSCLMSLVADAVGVGGTRPSDLVENRRGFASYRIEILASDPAIQAALNRIVAIPAGVPSGTRTSMR